MRDPNRFDVKEILLEQVRGGDKYDEKRKVIKAYTIGVDSDTSPAVAGREKFIWVRESVMNGAVHQVFNPDAIPLMTNFPCLITYSPRKPYRWEIYSVDWDGVYNFPSYTNQPFSYGTHAPNHEWPDGAPSTDPMSVYPRAFAPLRTYAGTGLAVNVWAHRYWYESAIREFAGTANHSLAAFQPASGLAVRILVYLNRITNVVQSVAGSAIGDSPVVTPPNPTIPNDAILSAFVRLDGDQTGFTESDIVDLRMHISETEQTEVGGSEIVTLDALALVESELDYDISRHVVNHPEHSHGEMYLTATATTTIAAISAKVAVIDGNNYVKAAGTTTSGNLDDFSMPANNRLRYDGTATKNFLVQVSASLYDADAYGGNTFCIKIAKNGTVIDATFVPNYMDQSTQSYAISATAIISMDKDDYLELFIANETSDEDVDLTSMVFVAVEIP